MRERLLKRWRYRAVFAGIAILGSDNASHAQDDVDVIAYFRGVEKTDGAGVARKTKVIDARPAKPGEIVVTTIKGEGKETQSPPAKEGDMVVRNRCPATGNEKFLVSANVFSQRYEGPISGGDSIGWKPYRPRGVEMRFVQVPANAKAFSFTAPWGEKMVARPGDVIAQNPASPEDTYRVAKAAFECSYEILRAPPAVR